MFKKDHEKIGKIILHWSGRTVAAQYFLPPEPIPCERVLMFATDLSALEFTILLGTMIGTDYKREPLRTDRYTTVFDFISRRAWKDNGHPSRPMAIHITVHTGHRMILVYFCRPPEVPDKKFPPTAQMEFLTGQDLMHALMFIDDLFEENSSSPINDIGCIKRHISQKEDVTKKILYTLRNPISSYNI